MGTKRNEKEEAVMRHWMFAQVFIGILVLTSSVSAYSGGAGTAEDPYQIATAEDLIALGNEPNDYDKHFILTADIDLSAYTFDRAVIAPDTDSSPSNYNAWIDPLDLFFEGKAFTGTFSGDRHIIRNLRIEGQDFLGLFGVLGETAFIRDLGIEDSFIQGTGEYIGGLVGCSEAMLLNCYNSGEVTGSTCVGGLVGLDPYNGNILGCYNSGPIRGKNYVGGLLGLSYSGSVVNCYNIGTITGQNFIGGLIGYNLGVMINSYTVGEIIKEGSLMLTRLGALVPKQACCSIGG